MKIRFCTCGQELAVVYILDTYGRKWGIKGVHCRRCGFMPAPVK